MTSLLRELTPLPISASRSSTSVSSPRWASARPTASPTTPAPTTTASTLSMLCVLLAAKLSRKPDCAGRSGGGARAACPSAAQGLPDRCKIFSKLTNLIKPMSPPRPAALMRFAMTMPAVTRGYRAAVDKAVAPVGLSQALCLPLVMLGRLGSQGDTVRQGVLADALGIEAPSLARSLDQLLHPPLAHPP